jgi:2-polyprenyl-3-methyl-5-hydroxy-6-metoxy-1,4-benzoquinol methylase
MNNKKIINHNTNLNKFSDLEEVSNNYDPSNPENDFDYWLIQFDFQSLDNYLIGDKVLELGCGKGVLTNKLAKKCKQLILVEGSIRYIDYVKEELKNQNNIEYHHSLWEEFHYGASDISDVIFSSGLEHINKKTAIKIFDNIKKWLRPGGKLHIIVPNANSLHRRVAYHMGLIKDVHELSDRDRLLKHERVFDKDILYDEIQENGFKITHWEGIFLKPLPNSMMMKFNNDIIKGFNGISNELPDYCAHIYTVCEK